MKVIENVTIYKCDFCKKELKRKHAMEAHEKSCWNNPENSHKCFEGCKYLTRKPIELGIGYDDIVTGEEVTRMYSGFFCELKKDFLVPKVIENRSSNNVWYGYDENVNEVMQEPMPKECDLFDHGFNF